MLKRMSKYWNTCTRAVLNLCVYSILWISRGSKFQNRHLSIRALLKYVLMKLSDLFFTSQCMQGNRLSHISHQTASLKVSFMDTCGKDWVWLKLWEPTYMVWRAGQSQKHQEREPSAPINISLSYFITSLEAWHSHPEMNIPFQHSFPVWPVIIETNFLNYRAILTLKKMSQYI